MSEQKWFKVYDNLHTSYSIVVEDTEDKPEVRVIPKSICEITEEEREFIIQLNSNADKLLNTTQEEYLQNRKLIIDPSSPLMDAPEIYHTFNGLEFKKDIIVGTIQKYFKEKYEYYHNLHIKKGIQDLIQNEITVFDDGDLKIRIKRYETFDEYTDRIFKGKDIEEEYEITDKLEKEFYNVTYNERFTYDKESIGIEISETLMKNYFETIEFKDMVANAEPFFNELNDIVVQFYLVKNTPIPKKLYMTLQVYGDGIINISERGY